MTDSFTWVLVIGLWIGPSESVLQVHVPMLDKAACEAASDKLRLTLGRRGKSDVKQDISWLGHVCEPLPEREGP